MSGAIAGQRMLLPDGAANSVACATVWRDADSVAILDGSALDLAVAPNDSGGHPPMTIAIERRRRDRQG
jgi:hypothetical protein